MHKATAIAEQLNSNIAGGRPGTAPPDLTQTLTATEWRVMGEVLKGNETSKGIGKALGISNRTVEIHLGHVKEKVDARSKLHAALIVDRALRVSHHEEGDGDA